MIKYLAILLLASGCGYSLTGSGSISIVPDNMSSKVRQDSQEVRPDPAAINESTKEDLI